jgi:hypothetical protein
VVQELIAKLLAYRGKLLDAVTWGKSKSQWCRDALYGDRGSYGMLELHKDAVGRQNELRRR